MMRGANSTILLLVLILSGCASMCDSSHDCDFHVYGGMRDRFDRKNGRVGSLFDPASAQPSIVPPQQSLAEPSTPQQGTESDSGFSDDQDSSEDPSQLRKRLLDELDKMNELPIIPDQPQADPVSDAI